MDTFKIIVIIFFIILAYQNYVLYNAVFKNKVEGFETKPQDAFSQVDDLNSINTLANIARKLMDGALTVPGQMTVQGNIKIDAGSGNNGLTITSGNPYLAFAKTGSKVMPQLYSDGNSLIVYDSSFVVNNALMVQGRDIIAELNNLNAKTAGLNLGEFVMGQEGPFLVIRNKTTGNDSRWAYLKNTNWG